MKATFTIVLSLLNKSKCFHFENCAQISAEKILNARVFPALNFKNVMSLLRFEGALKKLKFYLKTFAYSGDLKSDLVWISNGPKEVGLQMVWILNGI